MATNPEYAEQPSPREIIFNHYGVYLVTGQAAYQLVAAKDPGLDDPRNVVLVSQPDWRSTLEVLAAGEYGKTTVLTPELITIAGLPFSDLHERQAEVEGALQKVSQVSKTKPDATFIIGSPHFVEGTKILLM